MANNPKSVIRACGARSDLKILIRPNDRFGIIIIAACEWKMCEIGAIVGGMSVKMSNFVV